MHSLNFKQAAFYSFMPKGKQSDSSYEASFNYGDGAAH